MFEYRAGCKLVLAASLGGRALLSVGLLFLTGCGGGTSTQTVQPPVLSYSTPAAVYTRGTAIAPNPAINSGGAATSFMVTPALPAGLSLSTTTGVIGGTPTAVAAQATYTVTANNSGGSGHVTLSITVNDIAPSGLSYSVNPATYAVGASIAPNVPSWSNAGGTPTSFSGNLPSGLSLDSVTGIITGIPPQQVGYPFVNTYQITATNTGGSTSANLNLTIIPPAPAITIQPASQYVGSGISTYIGVGGGELGGIVSYQWYRNGAAISGSNTNVYMTPVLASANNGDQYYVVISDNYSRSVTSNVATLTIKGVSGTFINTGTPTVARDCETATLLQNSEVLFTGGRSGNTTLSLAELYDPATGTFTPTNPLATARCGHTATLLQNGQVLIAGGYSVNGNGLPTIASAELYDPSTGKFSATGSLGTGRSGHSATLLASGKVLIAGGSNSTNGFNFTPVAAAELYDPVAGTFSYTGSLNIPRSAPAVLLNNGQVLVVGGLGAAAAAEVYDPSTGAFSLTGSLITPRTGHSATLLQNGQVLVAGGDNSGGVSFLSSAEIYDPLTGTFANTGPLNYARLGASAALLPSGQVLIVGGDVNGLAGVAGNNMQMSEIYDPASGVFIFNAPTNAQRFFQTATLLNNGQVLIEGQETSAINVTQPVPAELYVP